MSANSAADSDTAFEGRVMTVSSPRQPSDVAPLSLCLLAGLKALWSRENALRRQSNRG